MTCCTLPMVSTRPQPRSAIGGTSACSSCSVDRRFTAICRSKCAPLTVCQSSGISIEAFSTRMSIGAQAVTAAARRVPASSSAKSCAKAWALPPSASMVATTAAASRASCSVPAWWIARRAPTPASARAMARPISRRAPVTRAVRPCRRNGSASRAARSHPVFGQRRDAAPGVIAGTAARLAMTFVSPIP